MGLGDQDGYPPGVDNSHPHFHPETVQCERCAATVELADECSNCGATLDAELAFEDTRELDRDYLSEGP
jgi:hypothetical protein